MGNIIRDRPPKLTVNYIRWLFSNGSDVRPMHFADNDGHSLEIYDPASLSAHQLAMLEAYPCIDLFPEINSARRLRETMGEDASTPQEQLLPLAKHTQVTWNPVSALKYLTALLYYSWAKRAMKGNSAASFTLFLPWLLLRAAHVAQMAGSLVFGPSVFVVNFVSRAVVPTLGYAYARSALFFQSDYTSLERLLYVGPKSHHPTKREVPAEWQHRTWESDDVKTPDLMHASRDRVASAALTKYKQQIAAAFSKATHTFAPLWELLEPLYLRTRENKHWQWALGAAIVLMLGTAGFLDYVLTQVAAEIHSRGNLRAGFMDQFGGHYAEAAWHYIADAAVVSWEHMQIGMEFFVYALVNKAVLPFFGWMDISIAHTSHATSAQVGTVLLEVLLPLMLVALYSCRMLGKCRRTTAQAAPQVPALVPAPLPTQLPNLMPSHPSINAVYHASARPAEDGAEVFVRHSPPTRW